MSENTLIAVLVGTALLFMLGLFVIFATVVLRLAVREHEGEVWAVDPLPKPIPPPTPCPPPKPTGEEVTKIDWPERKEGT